ncbi:MAG: hypothetical protein ABEJ56_04515 [Candidatus Nanohaloarchaea archaeon]
MEREITRRELVADPFKKRSLGEYLRELANLPGRLSYGRSETLDLRDYTEFDLDSEAEIPDDSRYLKARKISRFTGEIE